MLCITRKATEGVWLGPDIHVIITRVEGDRVRMAIDAPLEVLIERDEVRLRREQALRAIPADLGNTSEREDTSTGQQGLPSP